GGPAVGKIDAFLRRGTRLRSGCDLDFVPPATARLDAVEHDGDALLALARPIAPLIRAAFPGDETSRAFVVRRNYEDLLSRAGQGGEETEGGREEEAEGEEGNA